MVYVYMTLLFKIVSPSVAEIHNFNENLAELRKQLSYQNLSARFAYNKHKAKKWLEKRDPEFYKAEEERLKKDIYKDLFFNKNGKLCTYPGIIPYITIPHSVENCIKYPTFKTIPWTKPLPFTPYDYQNQIVEQLMATPHAHINAATGLGKTLCILMLARNTGLNLVITTPAESIFSDLLKEFEAHLGKSRVGAYGDGKKDLKKPITIAINKSLSMIKEGTEAWEFFSKKQGIIVDETHRFASEELSDTSFGVLRDIPYRWHLTATPVRGDGTQKLLNAIIGPCIFEMGLKEGIEKKFLSPLKFKIINTYSPSLKNTPDPIECRREHFLRNKNVAELAAKIASANASVKGESTLILVEELQQIQMIAKHLTVPYTYVHSGSGKEAAEYGLTKVDATEEIERFNKAEVRVIIGTRSVATGTNIFSHHTVNCMGGSSEVITKQGAMGRSTRQTDKSKYSQYHKPKQFCVVYDFNVTGQEILRKQLDKRISFYEETGETVVY